MLDVLVVGAGPSGLCAAKTFLECDDGRINLKVVDANKTVGGVWAQENLYHGLRTNNLRGGIDFTDLPMDDSFGIHQGEHISADIMHRYYKHYAQKWDILPRIDFDTHVLDISRLDDKGGWNVKVLKPSGEHDMQTKKLIIATGVTNTPHIPTIAGSDQFDCPIVHTAELGKKSDRIVKDQAINTVTVVGGGKSAYDAVYLAASAGREVEWIVRKSGKGPAWVFPTHVQLGPIRAWREKLPLRRFLTCFSPWFWEDGMSWLRYFLHFTGIGKKISQLFWMDIHHTTLKECLYAKEAPLNRLEPEQSPFWYGTHTGVYNFSPDLYDFLRKGQVRVHREDITHLSSHTAHLANGTSLPSDALITATGFTVKPLYTFSPSTTHSDLGIPTTQLTQSQRDFWSHLNHKAELTIVSKYPRLLLGPFKSPSSNVIQPYNPGVDPALQHTPFRLYRAIAPPGLTAQNDHSLVFIGMFSNVANFLRLEIQCLWAYAYLNDALSINTDSVFDETALFSRYARYRSPYGHGRFFPDLVFDQLPYIDVLMQDLGLRYWRKKNWFSEVFAAYGVEDYRGVVGEWKRKNAGTIADRASAGERRESQGESQGERESSSQNGWEHVHVDEKSGLLGVEGVQQSTVSNGV